MMNSLLLRYGLILLFASASVREADAQRNSCDTLGYVSAIAYSALHDDVRASEVRDRLRNLMAREPAITRRATLQEHVDAYGLATLDLLFTTLAASARRPASFDEIRLHRIARQSLRILDATDCKRPINASMAGKGGNIASSGAADPGARNHSAHHRNAEILPFDEYVVLLVLAVPAAFGIGIWCVLASARWKRRSKRYICGLDCVVETASRTISGRIIDISQVDSKVRLSGPPGTSELVTLRAGPYALSGRIIWSAKDTFGMSFSTGISMRDVELILLDAERQIRLRRRRRRRQQLEKRPKPAGFAAR